MSDDSAPKSLNEQAEAADNEYSAAYSDTGFWTKLKSYASSAGREVVGKALLLYYAAQEEKAPAWAKATIVGALGYFITPLDAVVDLTPGVGYVDDLGVLAIAIAAVATYINDDVKARASDKLTEWFGDTEDNASQQTTAAPVTTDADATSTARVYSSSSDEGNTDK